MTIVLRAEPGLDILFAGQAGPGPHNSVCGPGPGRVCTTAAGPGRAWASNHICGPGLGLNFQPVQGPSAHRPCRPNSDNLDGDGGGWVGLCARACVRTFVCVCVRSYMRACVICLPYTIILFDPG